MSTLLKLLPLIAFLFGVLFVWIFCRRRKVKAIAQILPFKVGKITFEDRKSGTATCNGIRYEYSFDSGISDYFSAFFRSYLSLSIPCVTYGHFIVYKWDFLRWLMEKIRLVTSFQTGDPNLDAKITIQTLTPDFARTFFSNAEMIYSILEISKIGFNRIAYDGEKLTAIWSPFLTIFQRKPSPTFIEETIKNLAKISERIQEIPMPEGVSKEAGKTLAARSSSLYLGFSFLVLMVLFLLTVLLRFWRGKH